MNRLYRLVPCLVACALFAAPEEEGGVPEGRAVVFSEFPILPSPGPEGTWVELYNRSDDAVDIGRHHVVCNGKRLVTFPGPFVLPGRSLLLVRFAPSHAPRWSVREAAPNTQVATAPSQVPDRGEASRVGSGFLALECPCPGAMDRLVDYVRWGSLRLAQDGSYQARAIQQGLWARGESRPLAPELAGEAPDHKGPQAERILARLSFSPRHDRGEAWTVLPAAHATPGGGNLDLPAPEPDVLNGETRYAGDGLRVRARPQAIPAQPEVLSQGAFRFQLARDPHFQEVVSTADSRTADYTFPEKLVPPGGYYLRVRWLTAGVGTPWSPPVFLRAR